MKDFYIFKDPSRRTTVLCIIAYVSTDLPGEDLGKIGKSFEFEGVAAWVEEEHRGLLTRLTGKANFRLNNKFYAARLESVGKLSPLVHRQNDAEMWDGHVVGIDVIRSFNAGTVSEVSDDLMSVEIEIYPAFGASSLFAAEHLAVKFSRGSEVVNGKCEMEKIGHKYFIQR